MPGFGKILALAIFLLLLALSTVEGPVFAQEQYYFQEEFNEERPPQTLNPDKWIVYPNRNPQADFQGCLVDTVRETGGLLLLKQCRTSSQFPYVVSKNNPFPNGDFSAAVRFQYPGAGGLPTGVKFVDKAPGNGEGATELFGFGFEEDELNQHPFRIAYKGAVVFSKNDDSNFYIFEARKEGNVYKLFLNSQLVFTSPETSEKVQAIYLGNPAILPSPGFGWSWPRIDYIRVIDDGPSEVIPQPFLGLPWDYRSQGKNLKDLIYNPYSWFDHKYPLQNFCCNPPIVDFTGKIKEVFYKSHSGYDYSSPQGVDQHTLVRAAADGTATFMHKDNSRGAGNMIKIDHGNGYQTWYEHLEEATPGSELIVKEEGAEPKKVTRGQVIGRVGLTGNTTGFHIHLSVFKDINGNGDFNDDKPFGLLDPLGWEGDYADPWEEYSVTDENKITKHGAKSYKLFTELSPPKTQSLTPSGGTITSDEFTMNVPSGSVNQNANFKIDFGPFEKASNTIKSIVPSLFLSAANNLGVAITNFNNPLGLIYDYSKADLSNVNEDSISFYSFNPATNLWEKLFSILDKNNKTISSQTTHFSQFAVMAELLDSIPPTTATEIIGDKGTNNWYRSNVKLKLIAKDNPGGKGVSYSVYSLDGENWNEYTDLIELNDEGSHKIYFLSHDNAGNREDIKSVEFSIDKTVPEAKVFIDLDKMDLVIEGVDQNSPTIQKQDNLETNKKDDGVYIVSDLAGNILTLDVRDRDEQSSSSNKNKKDQFRIHSLKYNEDSPITLEQNQFNVIYKDKKERLNIKEQNFQVKNEAKIKIQYDSKKDQSTIIAEESGLEKVKEIKNGLSLLWLKTDKGKLEYNY